MALSTWTLASHHVAPSREKGLGDTSIRRNGAVDVQAESLKVKKCAANRLPWSLL